jgi:predicted HTH transcriptional regulator
MLSDELLLALFRGEESDRFERKQSFADAEKVAQAICAFANDLPDHRSPGVIFIGQKDDRSCAGLRVDDDLLLRLSSLRSDGRILPFPTMNVRKMSLDGCDIAVIEVPSRGNEILGLRDLATLGLVGWRGKGVSAVDRSHALRISDGVFRTADAGRHSHCR